MFKLRSILALFILFGLLVSYPTRVNANHSWGNYHWARTNNPFTLKLGDNLTSNWDAYLAIISTDWSNSSVLDTVIVPGLNNSKNCRATSGKVEICNNKYGNNGWLGIAQIWISGDHITQGVTKINDTYFNTTKYNKPEWKKFVMCQEVGHIFGLDHQDEIFNNTNLGTCMDYTDDPSGILKNQINNEFPNQHDYDQLAGIYSHIDTFTTVQNGTQKLPLGLSISEGIQNGDFENRSSWGKKIKDNGHTALFERNFSNGHKLFTFTIWAQEQ